MTGLEDQLLGKLILKEKHELEEQRQQLLEEVQSYKKKIKQLEDDLLFRCALRAVAASQQVCRASAAAPLFVTRAAVTRRQAVLQGGLVDNFRGLH